MLADLKTFQQKFLKICPECARNFALLGGEKYFLRIVVRRSKVKLACCDNIKAFF